MNNHKKINILLVGLIKDKNLGDPIIGESVEFAIKNINPNAEIEFACLDEFDQRKIFFVRILSKLQRSFNIRPFKTLTKLYCNYFKKKLKNKDIAILVGGGLIKYRNQFFNGVLGLIEAAEEMNIPVAFNSVGVENYDNSNKKCRALKRALVSKAVCYISTRDDINTLTQKYFDVGSNKRLVKTIDPAVLIGLKYGEYELTDNIVGIGVCRFSIFEEYGSVKTANEIRNIYIELITELLQRNHKIELFTNGSQSDNMDAKALQDELKSRGYILKLNIPKSTKDLVMIISQYSQIIAARMHSCIIAYSLGIPTVGLVWNDKLKFWAENTNQSDRFLSEDDINRDKIIMNMQPIDEFRLKNDNLKLSLQKEVMNNISEILKFTEIS